LSPACLLTAGQEGPWYLIREPELRGIEEYRQTSEREKQGWLLQVQSLKARLGSLETESASLNSQLASQRELNRKLTQSFNEYEAEKLTQLSLRDGEIAELRVKNKAAAGQRNAAVIAAAALALAWLGYIAFKVCRFLKIIPV
jgi:chromosome segregation ATPase